MKKETKIVKALCGVLEANKSVFVPMSLKSEFFAHAVQSGICAHGGAININEFGQITGQYFYID